MDLVTTVVVGTTTDAVLSIWHSVYKFVCWHENIATVQDAVIKLNSCVAEIKIMTEFEDGCAPKKGAGALTYTTLALALIHESLFHNYNDPIATWSLVFHIYLYLLISQIKILQKSIMTIL